MCVILDFQSTKEKSHISVDSYNQIYSKETGKPTELS